ncbi:site-specific integrase [Granulicella arctica]|uniref:site-specific integrase n=1 Tax=Granulicella arctica TaxID=940613 RepID=UPI0021E006D5|nr:site-specific integrase [Granulicella arctica]
MKLGKQPLNGDKSMVNGAVTFGWFVLHRYLPLKEADWRDETAKVKKHLIQADLVDEFGDVRLENFDKFTLQTHLNKLAKTRSRDRVLQIRAYIKAIFAEAVDQDFLPKDPARTLKTPANLRETDKTVLSWEQLAAALARLGLRDRILLKLDMTNALRPSELFAFRWKCHRVEAVSLTIVETVYKGKIRSYGKTKGSLTEVPIAKDLSDDLVAWREVSQEQYDKKKKKHGPPPSDEEAFLFPNRDGSFMDPSNYRKRVLHKLATELGLPKLTFQVIRRTIATLAQKKGTVKDVQGMMRHSHVATTTDVYAGDAGGRSRHCGLHSPGAAGHDEEAGGEGQDATASHSRICGGGALMDRNFERKSAEAWRFREEMETTDMAWLHGNLKFAAICCQTFGRGSAKLLK